MAKNAGNGRPEIEEKGISDTLDILRRAWTEFLIIPTCIIACFLLLAFVTYQLDSTGVKPLQSVREFLKSHVFANVQATGDLLGAVAAGVITMTSITISLLLVAVQQTASSMTGAVYDQFLRRGSINSTSDFSSDWRSMRWSHPPRSTSLSTGLRRNVGVSGNGRRALPTDRAPLHHYQSNAGG